MHSVVIQQHPAHAERARELANVLRAHGAAVSLSETQATLVAAAPGLVINLDARMPRLSDHPTIAVMTAGLDEIFEQRDWFNNLVNCDAALVMDRDDELLLGDLSEGIGRNLLPGPQGRVGAGDLAARILAPLPAPAVSSAPLISVIMRCGGRPEAVLRRAVASVAAQDAGRYEIVFVRFRALDPAATIPQEPSAIVAHQVVDVAPDGIRALALDAGFKAARGALIAVLDDDDRWMRHHMRWLLAGLPRRPPGAFFGYSGTVITYEDCTPRAEPRLAHFGIPTGHDWSQRTNALNMNGCLASAALFRDYAAGGIPPEEHEDVLLQLGMMKRTDPWFSHGATILLERGRQDHTSDWQRPSPAAMNRMRRQTLRMVARLGDRLPGREPGPDWWQEMRRCRMNEAEPAGLGGALPEDAIGQPAPSTQWVVSGLDAERCNIPAPSALIDSAVGHAQLCGSGDALSHIAYLALPAFTQDADLQVECELTVTVGEVGLFLWDEAEVQALSHTMAAAGHGRTTLRLSLPPGGRHGRIVAFERAQGVPSSCELQAVRVVTRFPAG